jgi:sulfoxide reductase heme-binding subunit YedZ
MAVSGPWRALKPLVFLLALAPLVSLLAALLGLGDRSLGPNPVRELLHATGEYALNALLLTLLVAPLRDLSGQWQWLTVRRLLGLWAFAYALLHATVYVVLELDLDFSDLAREISRRPFIIVGFLSLLALLPLAITSTDRMMRRLKKRWQHLHYLIYPAAALAIWHFYWQVKADVLEPLIYGSALILLLAWRVHYAYYRRHS